MGKTYLKLEQVMERLQVSRTTLWRIVKEGRLRSYRFQGGKLKFFELEEVEAFQSSSMVLTSLVLVPAPVAAVPSAKGPGRPRKGAVVDFTGRQPRRKSA